MQLASVIGHATATVKHPSMVGLRLLIVQPLGVSRQPEADPLIVADKLGAGTGATIIIDSDGRGAREFVGNEKSPVRWYSVGIVDEKQ
jgi:ethanolamine utilization protein EutN